MNPWVILVGILLVTLAYVVIPVGRAMSAQYRRQKFVDCPAGVCPAKVLVGRTGLAEVTGIRALRRIRACSLWPGRQGCRQRCLQRPEDRFRDGPTPV